MELDENGVPVQKVVAPVGKPKTTVRAGVTKNNWQGTSKTKRKMAKTSKRKNRK